MERINKQIREIGGVLIIQAICLMSFPLIAQVPKLNSYPLAQATVFLDFDGHIVSSTPWNWDGPIHAEPASLIQSEITEIFERVAEDFRVFNINITTDSAVYANAPYNRRIRVIITPTSQWYQPEAGGVSFIGSFNWGDGTPAFVFSNLLYNQPKYVAEIISHETGHSLSLQHQSSYNGDCTLSKEYSEGDGMGEISWAPIMGTGYYKNVTTWNNGPSTVACHIWQNDLWIIAGPTNNNIGFREDDYSGSLEQATTLQVKGAWMQANGVVNAWSDSDAFRLIVPVSSPVKIKIDPMHVGDGNAGANVDLKLTLFNHLGEILSVNNPPLSLSTGLDTMLSAGTYYIQVAGTSNSNLPAYGSLGYYSLQGTMGTVLPVKKLLLKGRRTGEQHLLSWEIDTDEKINEISIESSADGNLFTRLTTIQPGSRSFTVRQSHQSAYYRLRLQTGEDKTVNFSNIIFIREGDGNNLLVQNKIVTNTLIIQAAGDGLYELIDAKGLIVSKGRFLSGNNFISTSQLPKGLFFLRAHANNQVQTYKLIKL